MDFHFENFSPKAIVFKGNEAVEEQKQNTTDTEISDSTAVKDAQKVIPATSNDQLFDNNEATSTSVPEADLSPSAKEDGLFHCFLFGSLENRYRWWPYPNTLLSFLISFFCCKSVYHYFVLPNIRVAKKNISGMTYTVSVITGNRWAADTDLDLFIILYGDLNTSGKHLLRQDVR